MLPSPSLPSPPSTPSTPLLPLSNPPTPLSSPHPEITDELEGHLEKSLRTIDKKPPGLSEEDKGTMPPLAPPAFQHQLSLPLPLHIAPLKPPDEEEAEEIGHISRNAHIHWTGSMTPTITSRAITMLVTELG